MKHPPPQVETPSPQVETPSPQVETPSPQVETPSPQVETPSPQVETPSPQGETPSPRGETPDTHDSSVSPPTTSAEAHEDSSPHHEDSSHYETSSQTATDFQPPDTTIQQESSPDQPTPQQKPFSTAPTSTYEVTSPPSQNFVEPIDISDLKGMKILVVGLAKTGVSLCHALANSGAEVTVSDHKSKPELANSLEQMEDINITYELGGHTPKVFLAQDLIILSPGISPNLKIFEYARSRGVKVTGEFEFASRFIKEPIIAVTGTNGKTTVCSLIQSLSKEVWNFMLGGRKLWRTYFQLSTNEGKSTGCYCRSFLFPIRAC